MPPRSADANSDIAIHHRIGHGTLNLTRIKPVPSKPVLPALPPAPRANSLGPDTAAGHEKSDEKAEDVRESERRGGFATIMHGALCVTGFLLVLLSDMLVIQYPKLTGSPGAFRR